MGTLHRGRLWQFDVDDAANDAIWFLDYPGNKHNDSAKKALGVSNAITKLPNAKLQINSLARAVGSGVPAPEWKHAFDVLFFFLPFCSRTTVGCFWKHHIASEVPSIALLHPLLTAKTVLREGSSKNKASEMSSSKTSSHKIWSTWMATSLNSRRILNVWKVVLFFIGPILSFPTIAATLQ